MRKVEKRTRPKNANFVWNLKMFFLLVHSNLVNTKYFLFIIILKNKISLISVEFMYIKL